MTGSLISHSGQDTTSGEVLQPVVMYLNIQEHKDKKTGEEKMEVACTSECQF